MAASKTKTRSGDDGYFRWLHFGNWFALDERRGRTNTQWVAFLEDLKELHEDSGPWDAIFISGDYVIASSRWHYRAATGQLERLRDILATLGSKPVVLTLPSFHAFVIDPRDPPIELHEYTKWRETLAQPSAYRQGENPGDFIATIESSSRRIGVAGVNTIFDRDDADEPGFSSLTRPNRLEEACGGDPDGWAGEHDVCLLLTAYASWELEPEDAAVFHTEIAPPGRFTLQFCGPFDRDTQFRCVQDGPTLVVKARPAVGDGGHSVPGYVSGMLSLAPGPEPVILRPRRYDAKSKAYLDDPAYSSEPVETYRRSVARAESPPRSIPAPSPPPAARTRPPGTRQPVETVPAADRLRVRYLEVHDFRCLELLRIDFAQPRSLPGQWTCLAGINGAGKSSILQALALGLLGEPLCRELGGDRLERMQRLTRDSRKEARIRIWLEEGMTRHYVELMLGGDDYETRWGKPGPPKAITAVWKAMRKQVVVAYGSTRNLADFIDSRYASLSPDVRRIMTIFDPLSQVTSAEYLLNKRAVENSPLPQLVRSLVKQVFDKELGVHVRGGKLRFSVAGEPVEAVDLPDGFRSSIAWLADLCDVWCQKAGPRKRPPKLADVEAIVLIDEIDLHLHPSLQRTLVPRLRKALPNVQWIVSTHSPLILSSFDSSELIALDRQEPGGVRVLDRQILGFTTDQVYNWLMGTPATSAALEESLEGGSSRADEEALAQLLQMSPEVDAELAARLASLRKERLKRLMP